MNRRVVITGAGAVTALGNDWATIEPRLRKLENATQYMDDWDKFEGLNTRLAAPVLDFKLPDHYTRKDRRSMGRVAMLSTYATELCLRDAGWFGHEALSSGRVGIAYGSSTGSTPAIKAFGVMLFQHITKNITANTYLQMMAHTAAVNIAIYFGLRGRVLPTCSACTSGSQAIGYAYEAIKHGYQDVMLAGGGEELCPTESAVFDAMFAASTSNDRPKENPRPFDKRRDGLVIGEGATTLMLEDNEHARARGAKIYAEVVGFGTNCDAAHITQPRQDTMEACLQLALRDAGLHPDAIDYVSAHGTATDRGDIAESHATARIFERPVPISSLKSYYGHTLGACGSMEAWLAIEMMNNGWFNPTLNLDEVDPRCAELDYITGSGRDLDCSHIMSNNFAFGGINTSLIFKRIAT